MTVTVHDAAGAQSNGAADDFLLEVVDLHTVFPLHEGLVKAVDGATFSVRRGRTLAVVGESGCGKSVTARSIMQIVDQPGRIVSGDVLYHRRQQRPDGSAVTETINLARMHPHGRAIRDIRGQDIAMVFQEPLSSFSPIHSIGNQIAEVILVHRDVNKAEARRQTIEQLRHVGMPQPERRVDEYPFQISGGMRQRAMIAMALACTPQLLIADEPTTALDVTTQAQILDLLMRLKAEMGMSIILITHDLGVVAETADDVAVMYLGQVVEQGDVDSVFYNPKHPYTRALLRSIPNLGVKAAGRLAVIRGMVPDPYNRPTGCPFHTRCPVMMPGICDVITPTNVPVGPGHAARCLLYGGAEQAVGGREAIARSLHVLAVSPSGAPEPAAMLPASGSAGPTSSSGMIADYRGEQTVATGAMAADDLLDVRHLRKYYPLIKGFLRRHAGDVRAVDDVSFTIKRGETLGLVGESGCGKTTLANCVLRAIDPTSGEALFRRDDGSSVDVATADAEQLKQIRRQMQMIFQDPYSSLNPRMTLLEIVGEPLIVNHVMKGSALADRVADLLRRVGLRPEYMRRYPHAFSGGERQRIGIARALALNPRLVVADEAVSALDVSVRAQTLNLLQDLQAEFGLTYLFVAHDLSVVEHISDRVAVMYVGQLVELAETRELYANPRHPYTEALLSAVPKPDPRRRSDRIVLQGDVADPSHPPSGCYFHPRCRYAQDICKEQTPALRRVASGHMAACHFAEQLQLQGVAIATPSRANGAVAGAPLATPEGQ